MAVHIPVELCPFPVKIHVFTKMKVLSFRPLKEAISQPMPSSQGSEADRGGQTEGQG